MTHNEIADYLAETLGDFGMEFRREYNPSPETKTRADLVLFDWYTRRPEIVIEVKSRLNGMSDTAKAIEQVCAYAGWLKHESPHATVLPLVVAEYLSPSINASQWRNKALVWSVPMFDYVMKSFNSGVQESYFSWQLERQPDRVRPITFTRRWAGFEVPEDILDVWNSIENDPEEVHILGPYGGMTAAERRAMQNGGWRKPQRRKVPA